MAEYIEREKVYEMLHAIGGCGAEPRSWADGWDKAIDTAIEKLAEIPAADVRPERYGQWIEDEYAYNRCSECGFEYEGPEYVTPYCPNCGAKMDGEDGEKPNA